MVNVYVFPDTDLYLGEKMTAKKREGGKTKNLEDEFERTRRIYKEAYETLEAAARDPTNMRPEVVAYREILRSRARK